jgi:hypothetical protein
MKKATNWLEVFDFSSSSSSSSSSSFLLILPLLSSPPLLSSSFYPSPLFTLLLYSSYPFFSPLPSIFKPFRTSSSSFL